MEEVLTFTFNHATILHMKRTISIKLIMTHEQSDQLKALRTEFNAACNSIIPVVKEQRCWNKVDLHHLVYYPLRLQTKLGSQMTCNVIRAVCDAYKALKLKKSDDVPAINFKPTSSIHYDKRTYSIKENTLSLYTLNNRIQVSMQLGEFQENYLKQGTPKEAEVICRKGTWYFNLSLDYPEPTPFTNAKIIAVDLGENNLAVISTGKIFKGGKIWHEREKYLGHRSRLQSNGSQSAKQRLKKVSGKESRRMKHTDHVISKQVVEEAASAGAGIIVLENLTNIRKRIRARKRERSRHNKWSFNQLQQFVEYKAQARGIRVIYVNPAYSSKLCSVCGNLGKRLKHRFRCLCGSQQHADLNASHNLCRFALSADSAMY